jgi:hypothetical protein
VHTVGIQLTASGGRITAVCAVGAGRAGGHVSRVDSRFAGGLISRLEGGGSSSLLSGRGGWDVGGGRGGELGGIRSGEKGGDRNDDIVIRCDAIGGSIGRGTGLGSGFSSSFGSGFSDSGCGSSGGWEIRLLSGLRGRHVGLDEKCIRLLVV